MPVSNRFQDVRGDDSGRQAQRSADACGGLCRRADGRRRSGSAVFIRAQRAEARRDRPAREPPGPGAGGPAARGRKRPDRHGGQRSDRAAKHDAPLGLPPDVYGDAPLRTHTRTAVVDVWASGGRVRAESTDSFETRYLLTDGETVCIWYEGETPTAFSMQDGATYEDLAGLPTYEDIIRLPVRCHPRGRLPGRQPDGAGSCLWSAR